MKVIALGGIADKFLMDDLPERGVVIEATKDELQNLPTVLYREVEVVEKKPPRNCDVGTSTEQMMRFEGFCYNNRSRERCCGDCPIKDAPCCELAWAQMPYEEGGAR